MLSRELLSMTTQTDLIEQIDWKSVECLNAHPDHGVNNALKQVRLAPAAQKDPFASKDTAIPGDCDLSCKIHSQS